MRRLRQTRCVLILTAILLLFTSVVPGLSMSKALASGTLFEDDFEDGNADGWQTTSGIWAVATSGSNKTYKQSKPDNSGEALAGSTLWTDYTLVADVKLLSGSGAILKFRYQSSLQHYFLYMSQTSIQILKQTASGQQSIGYYGGSGLLSASQFTTMKVQVTGSTITVYRNGNALLSATDSSYSSGKIGLATWDTTAEFDHVAVTSTTGNTYYVSNSLGNDGNSGLSPTTPWKTMAKVSGMTFQPGDCILLKAGDTWNERLTLKGTGTINNPITVTSYDSGNKPVISANAPNSGVVYGQNLNHWLIRGLAVKVIPSANLVYTNKSTGILVEYDTTKVHEGLRIEGNEVYSTTPDSNTYGINIVSYVQGSSYGLVAKDMVIAGNKIHDLGWYAIITAGWDSANGTSFHSQESYQNFYVAENEVTNMGNQGIVIGNAHDSAIERNVVRAGGQANSNGYGPGGLWYVSSRDSVIRFNEVSEMKDSGSGYDGAGINIDWYCSNITVQYNYSHDNKGNGFTTMSNNGGKILSNKARGNKGEQTNGRGQIALGNFTGLPAKSTGTHNMEVSGNTIIVDIAGTNGMNSAFSDDGVTPVAGLWTGNKIANNNIVLKSGFAGTSVFNIGTNAIIDEIKNNRIYSSNSTFIASNNGTAYNDLSAWQSGTGYDSGTQLLALDNTLPSTVSAVTSTLNGGYVQLSWSAAADSGSGIAHYNIYRGTTPGFTPAYSNMVGESTVTSFLDKERPKSNTTYYYKIEAEDYNGNNGSSSAAYTAVTGFIS
ncbi:family 16 glycoside hydrolase [Paenibacillus sp. JDR-2]|uniref:family 16 glycoside hydrolase n=1 Tax=Paenibacillus sp. (strain JDR-2) TaxID=324057 RepID=UPI000166672C|nr:family 16 glycoside hydrolase [Paenibacillus sp. JDR-2]ACS99843.1 hypothetical protein Pjdr2_1166 [Paenibacillus sp. JDR-2]